MKIFLIKIIFLTIGLSLVKSDCSFRNFTNNYQPLFFQKIHSETFFVPANNNTISIPDGGSVQAYCSEGFRRIKVGGEYNAKEVGDKANEITIECRKSIIYAKIEDDIYSQGLNLQCKKSTITLHSVRTHTCGYDKNAYIMGLEYNSQKLAFAEICYDFAAMQLKYIYHRAASRSPLLSQEKKNSVVDAAYHNPVEQISNSLSISEEEIKSQTKVLFGSIAGAVEYVYDHLVALDSFDPFVTDSMDTTSYLTKILWWKPLKEGNWRLFLDLLKKQSLQNEYNVITGVSGVVKYYQKNCPEYTDLKFEVNGLKKTAPRLIWSYLTLNPEQYHDSRHTQQNRDGIDSWYPQQYPGLNNSWYSQQNSTNSRYHRIRKVESFVVVGYNSPFFDVIDANNMCQKDICRDIPWLSNLWKTQRSLTLGNIICCTPEEARLYIPELPTPYFGKLIGPPSSTDESADRKDPESNEEEEDDPWKGN